MAWQKRKCVYLYWRKEKKGRLNTFFFIFVACFFLLFFLLLLLISVRFACLSASLGWRPPHRAASASVVCNMRRLGAKEEDEEAKAVMCCVYVCLNIYLSRRPPNEMHRQLTTSPTQVYMHATQRFGFNIICLFSNCFAFSLPLFDYISFLYFYSFQAMEIYFITFSLAVHLGSVSPSPQRIANNVLLPQSKWLYLQMQQKNIKE